MRYVVKVVCLVFALVANVVGKDDPFLSKLLARSVSVETNEGHGTGVVISSGVVLTNFHLLHTGSDVKVNGKDAKLLQVDPKNDLLLLSADTAPVIPVVFAEEISQDEEIVVIGNPLGHKSMISRGRIIDIDRGKLYIDAHVFLGSSGGGVFNTKGELVGVVVGIEGGTGDGFPFGIVISSFTISDFLPKTK